MKVIMVMFDSLNRHMLPPYGCDWTHAPNFARLAARSATFDRSYVCSMPCMPARRDFHTGRPNFLHRGWGPLEPYDDSVPQMLKQAGVYTHLASDHQHYWEDGGATYHGRYNAWEFFRGQEGDAWHGQVAHPKIPPSVSGESRAGGPHWRQDWIHREIMRDEADQPQTKTFAAGLDFIRRNRAEDRWFLHLETFDPHEPFFSQQKYKDLYPHDYMGPHFDWPPYRSVQETAEQVEHCRKEYAALLSMCDANLGKVLDLMDEQNMWEDTMLIVWTDHGFMLGEHNCWAKIWQPWYQELANTPFFVWDPRSKVAGQRRRALVQPSLDLGPTLLDFFGLAPTKDMLGKPLGETIATDKPVREAAIFGHYGSHVNVTDGRHVYMRAPDPAAADCLNKYWLMPSHMRGPFTLEEIKGATIAEPFSFTKGCPVVRTPSRVDPWKPGRELHTALYDIEADPSQTKTIEDPAVERRMTAHLTRCMKDADAPVEQYRRLGLAMSGK